MTQTEYMFTLVPGTWAARLDLREQGDKLHWFEDGSSFRSDLREALKDEPLSFREFHWSCRNRVLERSKAAINLASQIRSQIVERPGATQVIIAHSHGGNVALLSLRLLNEARSKVRLVSLATPFVQVLSSTQSHLEPGYTLL